MSRNFPQLWEYDEILDFKLIDLSDSSLIMDGVEIYNVGFLYSDLEIKQYCCV